MKETESLEVVEMRKRIHRYEVALCEIAVGKVAHDNEHPLGAWASMAGRTLSIAQEALSGGVGRALEGATPAPGPAPKEEP